MDSRVQEAVLKKQSGYNCAQAVACTYCDLVGMDEENMWDMRRICGGDRDGKISLLMDWAGSSRDVADPWYTGDFEATYQDLITGCTALLERVKESVR